LRNLIIGTAGHVDHGKTEIVKALTGRDTDRLKEEKQRGISIVLGFAPLDLGDGIFAGVVDVPGHERFVKNMVSGAAGVDLALLVVAADEGVMPQTEEHLEVLRLLGVGLGVIAITKVDLVDPELVEIVESEVRDLVKGGPLEGAPLVRTSVATGEGLDKLLEALRSQAAAVHLPGRVDFFRMPVDRVFTRRGIGTVVTGTTWSGEVGKGDDLVVEPVGKRTRVREVQSFDRSLDSAKAGIRTALALHGVKVDEIFIGCQVLSPGALVPSPMLDAFVEVSKLPGSRLKNRQRVRFHHAAAEIMARVILLDRDELEAGESGFVQLRLEGSTVARSGDRFVLRSYSPMRVVSGGKILDPVPVKKRRFRSETISYLKGLDEGSNRGVVLTLASKSGPLGVSPSELGRYGMTAEEAEASIGELEGEGLINAVGGRLMESGFLEASEGRLIGIVDSFASENRLLWGIDREELKEKMGLGEGPLFDFLLEKGKREGRIFFKGWRVRTGSAEMDLSEEDRKVLTELENRIRNSGFEFPTRADLIRTVGDEKRLASYLHILHESGSIVRVSSDGFIHAELRAEVLGRLRERLKGGGTLSIADFKDDFGFSRKYAVPLLEYLDSEGFTRREGDVRVAGPRLLEVL
jgi:selenocysteine-specific elongation factor